MGPPSALNDGKLIFVVMFLMGGGGFSLAFAAVVCDLWRSVCL